MHFRTEGIILKKRNFQEADRILTIYTKDFGKLTCIAKGVRRPRSKKSGHVELGNWCNLFIAKGKNLDLIQEVELKKAFGMAQFDEKQANQIYHLLELVDHLTAHNQVNREVFLLLVHFLKQISKADVNFDLVSAVFKTKLLGELGFFSSRSIPSTSKSRAIIEILEKDNLLEIGKELNLDKKDHLKLLAFLDSIIENIAQSKIKTNRFLHGS